MTDPLTLGALGGVVLGEGIRFLYDQARELLARWRAKRDREVVDADAAGAEVLDAPLPAVEVPAARVSEHAELLTSLRRELIEYAEEGRAPEPGDHDLLRRVEALRRALEVVRGQRITFSGEARERTGTRVDVAVEAVLVEGYVAGLRARGGLGGVAEVRSDVRIGRVAADGEAVGVDLTG